MAADLRLASALQRCQHRRLRYGTHSFTISGWHRRACCYLFQNGDARVVVLLGKQTIITQPATSTL